MRPVFRFISAAVLGIALLSGQALDAQHPISPRGQERIQREVRHELVMLPFYTVFDNLEYQVNGETVTLSGKVIHATLKSDAENVVKRIEGVTRVINQIEILPPSPMDDRIRMAVYRTLFNEDSSLFRYGLGSVPSIHIIVDGGRVTLAGVVDNETDKNTATLLVNGIPGIFAVKNNLVVNSS